MHSAASFVAFRNAVDECVSIPTFISPEIRHVEEYTAPANSIALIVGNGLSIYLLDHQAPHVRQAWDALNVLSWRGLEKNRLPRNWTDPELYRPGHPFILLPEFHWLRESLSDELDITPSVSAFDLIVRAIRRQQASGKDRILVHPCWRLAQQYLAFSFSHFDRCAQGWIHSQLPWVQWLRKHRKSLGFAVSFNYDCVLEGMIRKIGGNAYRTAIRSEKGNIPVLKPHGSIDFCATANQPQKGYIIGEGIDMEMQFLEETKRLGYRAQVSIVVPAANSHLRRYQFVEPGWRAYVRNAGRFSYCVLIGVSYWEVDRPEINELLAQLRSDVILVIVNPADIHPELIMTLQRLGICYEHWRHGPQDLRSLPI